LAFKVSFKRPGDTMGPDMDGIGDFDTFKRNTVGCYFEEIKDSP
jgi:hypothetical protein